MDWTERDPAVPVTGLGRAAVAAAASALTDLTVTDLGVAVSVGGEDAAERCDARGVLEGGVVGEGAVQVALDLLRGQAALPHRRLHQFAVVAFVGLQL